MANTADKNKIPLGRTLISAAAKLQFPNAFIQKCMERHEHCDWGDVSPGDSQANDRAQETGDRILSAYKYPDSMGTEKLWIQTEGDRSYTTAMSPGDY